MSGARRDERDMTDAEIDAHRRKIASALGPGLAEPRTFACADCHERDVHTVDWMGVELCVPCAERDGWVRPLALQMEAAE